MEPALKRALLAAAALILIAGEARAASTTPPNLTAATGASTSDLMLVWPAAGPGPLESITWANVKAQLSTDLASTWLRPSQNLADIANTTTARANLGLGTAALASTGTSGLALGFLNGANTWSGVQTHGSGDLVVSGSTSGALTLNCAATCGTSTITFPAGTTNFSATGGTSQVVKQTSAGGALTVGQLQCSDLSDGGNGGCSSKVVSGSLAPTLQYTSVGTSSFSYTGQTGAYVCVAGYVSGYMDVKFTPTNGTGSGNLVWNNPPYSNKNPNSSPGMSAALYLGGTWSSLSATPYFFAGWTASQFAISTFNAGGNAYITPSNTSSGSAAEISAWFNYLTSTGTC